MTSLKASYPKILIAIILFIITISLYNFFTDSDENTEININQPDTISINWTLENENVSLPHSYASKKGEKIILYNTIPNDVRDGDVLSFLANYSINEIYIDNHLVYSYGNNQISKFGHMIGNIRCIVELKEEYAGKSIAWEITPYYSQPIEIPIVNIGPRSEIILNVLKVNLWKITAVTIYLIIAIMLTFMLIYRKIKKFDNKEKMMACITLFCYLSAFWIFNDSDLPQFIGYQNQAFSFLSFISLSLMPPVFCDFINGLCQKNKKSLEILKIIGILSIVIQSICYLFDIKDPIEFLILTHLLIIIVLIVSFLISVKTFSKDISSKIICFGIIGFMIAGFSAIVNFYKHPGSPYTSAYFTVGLIIISLSQFFILLVQEVKLMKSLTSASIYKKLAYKDVLTNLENRASMEKHMKKIIEKNNMEEVYVGFVMCDINYLKETNDNFGHEAGDELIKGGAQCLNEAFNDVGKCYRLGGDEFTVILTKEIPITETLKKLENIIKQYNNTHEYKLSMAYGYSKCILYKNSQEDLKKLYKESDENMYKMKQEQHKNKN